MEQTSREEQNMRLAICKLMNMAGCLGNNIGGYVRLQALCNIAIGQCTLIST